jgi:protocatechuate 3,4-dioxygenase beta subunit
MPLRFSRREAIATLGLTVAGAGLAASPAHSTGDTKDLPNGCALFPEAVEGPYYLDPRLVRSDITEGRPGLPIRLRLRIIAGNQCLPLQGARVDIWHADCDGIYSGFAGQGDRRNVSSRNKTYLRGTQFSEADGLVEFRSIFPGWYLGRTPHLHIKVFADKATAVTGQMYFTDELSARIYREHPAYAARPRADTTNQADFIFRSSERKGGIVLTTRLEGDQLIASLDMAIRQPLRRASGLLPGPSSPLTP